MNCKVCSSPYKDLIESLLSKNISTRKITRQLKEKHGVSISHTAINNHRRYHYLPLMQHRDSVISLLYRTGNYRLVRKIMRTKKVVKKYPRCTCSPFSDRPIRGKGLVFICGNCSGWILGNVGRQIKRRKKKEITDFPLVITASFRQRRY